MADTIPEGLRMIVTDLAQQADSCETQSGVFGIHREDRYEVSANIKDWLYDGRKYRDAILMQRVF